MCYLYRHRHVCCDCGRVMSSQDKTGWCERRAWIRPSPFEHAVAYCPEGTKLVHLDYKVMRCVACHFDPPGARHMRAVDTPRQDTRLREQQQQQQQRQQQRLRQGRHDETLERNGDEESETGAPGLLRGVGRCVGRVLAGWAVTILGGVPAPPDHPAHN
ncbi:hypothetical protein LZ30DRAFT_562658, partial [Colletotrichum cereale]